MKIFALVLFVTLFSSHVSRETDSCVLMLACSHSRVIVSSEHAYAHAAVCIVDTTLQIFLHIPNVLLFSRIGQCRHCVR